MEHKDATITLSRRCN